MASYSELGFPASVSCVNFHPHDHMVAFSSLSEDSPVHIYKYDHQSMFTASISHVNVYYLLRPCWLALHVLTRICTLIVLFVHILLKSLNLNVVRLVCATSMKHNRMHNGWSLLVFSCAEGGRTGLESWESGSRQKI